MPSLLKYVLHLADNAFIHSHRLSEWCGHAPELEIDIALSNIGLDNIGAARSFYQYAATLKGENSTEDTFVYQRTEREFYNILMLELPNGDFAKTIATATFFSAYQYFLYDHLCKSTDVQIAAIAQKSLKEINYHLRFASEWMMRLGDGTETSAQKMQAAINETWAYTGEMFMANESDIEMQAQNIAPDLNIIYSLWKNKISEIIATATLQMPEDSHMFSGGKLGQHTENMGKILPEVQYLQHVYPGAEW
jgi:ring-1,2-phenylacetyl-CoA epoxidase subunit PaaC